MASLARGSTDDARRTTLSPRPKGRDHGTENVKETLCRNVTIYGHCRYENKGCSFNHDPTRGNNSENMKKRFNVDSPSFTPSVQSSPSLSVNGVSAKTAGISPKAASAAPFKPKTFNGSNEASGFSRNQYNPAAADWSLAPSADANDFIPQGQPLSQNVVEPDSGMNSNLYNAYTNAIPHMNENALSNQPNPLLNTFSTDPNQNLSSTFFSNSSMEQPPNYHLYSSFGPRRENLGPHQRVAQDFFIPDDLREELQKKSTASHQTMQVGVGLMQLQHLHSFVPLDMNPKKNATIFGYPSAVYKVTSSKDGKLYALRRLEGFKLTNEEAMRSFHRWRAVSNANIVTVVEAFTNRGWSDGTSSLFVVTEYHPCSKTLAETHFMPTQQFRGRDRFTPPDAQTIWNYMVQISNALKTIHTERLAARVLDPSKVLVTGENRIRLNACGIPDIVKPDPHRPVVDLQRQDLILFGRLIAVLGLGQQAMHNQNTHILVQEFRSRYPGPLADRVGWLTSTSTLPHMKSIDEFIKTIEPQVMSTLNASLNQADELTAHLTRELENARLFRLMTKLNFITERPEHGNNAQQWAETGERYPIKLFRDYVFHQVDENGLPSVDLAHVLSCLNKLDAGSEERMTLTSRDEQTAILVSYKEMKRAIASAYDELANASRRRTGF